MNRRAAVLHQNILHELVRDAWANERRMGSSLSAQRLTEVFSTTRAECVTFFNPPQNAVFTQTVYLARTAAL